MEFYILDLFLLTLFFDIASITEGVEFRLQLLSRGSYLHVMDETEEIQRSKEIIDDHRTAIRMAPSLVGIIRIKLLTQFMLFSLTFASSCLPLRR